jgi:hypothetical protein
MTVADFANVTVNGVTNFAAKACSLDHKNAPDLLSTIAPDAQRHDLSDDNISTTVDDI